MDKVKQIHNEINGVSQAHDLLLLQMDDIDRKLGDISFLKFMFFPGEMRRLTYQLSALSELSFEMKKLHLQMHSESVEKFADFIDGEQHD